MHFGVPQATHTWSEAQTQMYSIYTRDIHNVDLKAEVDGEIYTFAVLGTVTGRTHFTANLPAKASRVFISVDGTDEISIQANTIVNIDDALASANKISRAGGEDMNVTLTDRKPKVSILGKRFLDGIDMLCEGFVPGDNTKTAHLGYPKKTDTWYGSRRASSLNETMADGGKFKSKSFVNVYPLFTRKNKYGEDDYVVGIYYRYDEKGPISHIDLCRPGELNAANNTIRDLDGNTRPVDPAKWITEQGLSKDLYNGNNPNFLTTEGRSVDVTGFINGSCLLGFYVKSGIEDFDDKIEPNHCKYTHICYGEAKYNKVAWENDADGNNTPAYYDVELERVANAYAGAIGPINNPVFKHKDTPSVKDRDIALIIEDNEEFGHANYPCFSWFGFTSPAKEVAEAGPDFCDFVLLCETTSGIGWGQSGFSNKLPVSMFPWFLAAEDLGATDDWDYNDLIVAVYDMKNNYTAAYVDANGNYPAPTILGRTLTVKPMAAGATLPDYLMYEGKIASGNIAPSTPISTIKTNYMEGTYIVGTEIHSWLREPDYTRVLNTQEDRITHRGRAVSFTIPYDNVNVDYDDPSDTFYPNDNTLAGFWVMVDKTDKGRYYETTAFDPDLDLDDIEKDLSKAVTPFNDRLGNDTYRVDVPSKAGSVAPQMILCHRSWYWPRERVPIDEAWPKFSDWVKDHKVIWHSLGNNTELGLYYPEKVVSHEDKDVTGLYYFPED